MWGNSVPSLRTRWRHPARVAYVLKWDGADVQRADRRRDASDGLGLNQGGQRWSSVIAAVIRLFSCERAARCHHPYQMFSSAGPQPLCVVTPSKPTGAWAPRMQVKHQMCSERSSSTDDPEQDDNEKKTSCFSNIKIFLVAECALMLAQGTVGAYLVSEMMGCSVDATSSSHHISIITSSDDHCALTDRWSIIRPARAAASRRRAAPRFLAR